MCFSSHRCRRQLLREALCFIAEALEREYPAHMQGKRLAALDTLIPLNLKAATALSIAYEDFGTWREEPELLARATRDLRKAA